MAKIKDQNTEPDNSTNNSEHANIVKLLAVDGNSILNRAYYGVRMLTTKDGIYTNAIFGFLSILLKITQEVQPTHFAICFDVSRKTFRNEQYSLYKGTRKGMPDELRMQLPLIKELLGYLGYTVIGKEGFEADDLLGTFSAICTEKKMQCVIATGDRDSLQLVNNFTSVHLASTKQGQAVAQMIDEKEIKVKYGLDNPKSLIEVKAIMGDTSDNIPGVAGIGEKGALKLITQFMTLDGVYKNIDSPSISDSVRKKLIDSKEMAYLSRSLATIKCDVEFDWNLESYKKSALNFEKAAAMLAKLEMFSMFDRLNIPRDGSEYAGKNRSNVEVQLSLDSSLPQTKDECSAKNDQTSAEFPQVRSKSVNSDFEISCKTTDKFLQETKIKKEISIYSEDYKIFFAYCDKTCCKCSDPSQIKKILETENPKMVFRAKEFYLYCYENNISAKNIVDDGVLIAYLLNPSTPTYTIENLCASYEIPLPDMTRNVKEIEQESGNQQLEISNEPDFYKFAYGLELFCKTAKPILKQKGLLDVYDKIEMPLAKVLAAMEHNGILIDREEILIYSERLTEKIDSLEKQIYQICGFDIENGESFNINSPKQLGEVLFERLGLPVIKKTKTGYSTNSDVLNALRSKHPVIDLITMYRQYSKLNSTYTTAFLDLADKNDKIHTSFIQTETKTGRISSVNPNMQNIPVRTETGRELRKFFKAEEGYTLVDADYSQIELRVLAHISKDKKMIEAFKNGEDIHTKTASEVFNMPPDFITDLMRRRAKAVNFGIVYGIGAYSLSQDIEVKMKEAKEYIQNYLQTYSGVKIFMEKAVEEATQSGFSTTLFGRIRYIPELRATNKIQNSFGKRVAMNSPIQGTAADIIKIAMIKVFCTLEEKYPSAKLILQVHDELIVCCKEEDANGVCNLVKEQMEAAAQLSVPLVADVHTGKTWYDAKS